MGILNVALAVATVWCTISNGLSLESSCVQNDHTCKADTQTGGAGMVQKKRSLESATLEDRAELTAQEAMARIAVASNTSLLARNAKDISDKLQRIAEQLPASDTKALLQSFRICGGCNNFVRVGEAHDGGYLICPELFEAQSLVAVYSLGIEQHDKFSLDMHNRYPHADVLQFDCTVDEPAQQCDKCKFYKVCLEGEKQEQHPMAGFTGKLEGTYWSLPKALAQTGKANVPDRSLMLKMDIEGAEWQIFAGSSSSSNWLRKFNQIVVEFHNVNNKQNHGTMLSAMNSLRKAGFVVAHLHGNNCCNMYETGGYSIPNIVEVTFVSQGEDILPQKDCLAWEPRHPLDGDNIENKAPLPEGKLP